MRVRNLAAVIIAFTAVACNDGTAPTAVAVRSPLALGAPLASLVDGGNGGNPAFLFLPPLSSRHGRLPSKLDRTVEPVVAICQLATDRTQCENQVVEFTRTDGHGRSEQIQVSGNHFSVNWQTRGLHLDRSKFYRICVSIGGHALGHADVAIVKRGRANDAGEGDFPLQRGRPLAIEFWIGEGALDQPADAGCGGGGGTVPATISGRVSGPIGDAAAVDYTVYLLNPTDLTFVASTTTDVTGTYTFTSSQFVPETPYLVCEANPLPPLPAEPQYIYQEMPMPSSDGICDTSLDASGYFPYDTAVYAQWGYLVTAPASAGPGVGGKDFRNGILR